MKPKMLFLLLVLIPSMTAGQTCYSQVANPYAFFGTKTGYFALDNENTSRIEFPGCEAKSFWLLARHGTRNPGDGGIVEIQSKAPDLKMKILENNENGKGTLCDADIEKLKNWNFSLKLEDQSLLTESGEQEQYLLGERFRKRFPDLLNRPFEKKSFQFRHTKKQRTEASAQAYAKGAFPNDQVYIPPAIKDDPLLRFYDACSKWLKEVDENDKSYREQDLFGQSAEMKSLISRVEQRLGFNVNSSSSMKLDDISVMYDLCRYEKAFEPDEVSVWCSVFDQEDLEVLEYHQDLKYWYINGYGYEINHQMPCLLINNALSIFKSNASSRPKGTFYFSHSVAILPTLSLFGLFQDPQPLKHTNFVEMQNRKYRTSLIGSFSASLALVLFQCNEESKVLLMHQEKPVKLGKCQQLLCSLSEFEEGYLLGGECNFDEICQNPGQNNGSALKNHILILISLLTTVLLFK